MQTQSLTLSLLYILSRLLYIIKTGRHVCTIRGWRTHTAALSLGREMAVRLAFLKVNGWGKREVNRARAEEMIGGAAGKKAQVLLLPEFFHELFFIPDLNSRYFEAAEPIPGPITDAMCE